MKDLHHGFNEGDKVILDDFIDDFQRGDIGVIDTITENNIVIDFGEKGFLATQWYHIKAWVDIKELNPRKRLQHQYAQWVDDVCYMVESKTSVSMDEVQAIYSELAIKLVVKELKEIAGISGHPQRLAILDRIEYLESLI
jgi:hypothetical protein